MQSNSDFFKFKNITPCPILPALLKSLSLAFSQVPFKYSKEGNVNEVEDPLKKEIWSPGQIVGQICQIVCVDLNCKMILKHHFKEQLIFN